MIIIMVIIIIPMVFKYQVGIPCQMPTQYSNTTGLLIIIIKIMIIIIVIIIIIIIIIGRLYIPRKEGGRGLISIKDCVELAIRGLEVYVHGCEEILIQAARGNKIDGLEAASVLKRSMTEKRLKDW